MLKNIITNKSESFLKKYLNNPSPTGFESGGQKLWLDYLKPYIDTHFVDTYGTVVGVINPNAKYKVVIEILSCGDSTCNEESPYYECSLCPSDCLENINCLEESDCSNNIDDDGDGNIDCDDPDCMGNIFCE